MRFPKYLFGSGTVYVAFVYKGGNSYHGEKLVFDGDFTRKKRVLTAISRVLKVSKTVFRRSFTLFVVRNDFGSPKF